MRYSDYFKTYEGNLGWCKPFVSEDGKVKYVLNEGEIIDLYVNGRYIKPEIERPGKYSRYSDAQLKRAAKLATPYYDEHHGWTDEELLLQHCHECNCSECHSFRDCEAMREPYYGDGDDTHWAIYEIEYTSPRTGKPVRTTRRAESAVAAIDALCDRYGWRSHLKQIDAAEHGREWAECSIDPDGGINYSFSALASWVG